MSYAYRPWVCDGWARRRGLSLTTPPVARVARGGSNSQPFQYRYPKLQYKFAVTSGSPSTLQGDRQAPNIAPLYSPACRIHIYSGGCTNIRRFPRSVCISIMVLILDGISEHVAHVCRKKAFGEKCPICDCSRYNQLPYTYQRPEITPYVRTYCWVTI